MRKNLNKLFLLSVLSATVCALVSFIPQKETQKITVSKKEEGIKWYTFTEAVALNKKNPKKIFIDVYTSWCGWCKVMDKKTFTDPNFIKLLNKYYYAVKLDAEMKDSIRFNNFTFKNLNPNESRSVHQLAAALLQNKMSYPTSVFLDEQFALLSPVPGYNTPQSFEPILLYFGENKHKTTSYEEYMKTFKASFPPPPPEEKPTAPGTH